MNFKHVLLSSAAVAMMAGAAQAADLIVDVPVNEPVAVAGTGWYLSVFAGGVWDAFNRVDASDLSSPYVVDSESDMGWLLGAAVGTQVFDNVRGEIELSGSTRNVTSSQSDELNGGVAWPADVTTNSIALLGNLWLDLDTGSGFTPYIGGGLGVGFVQASGAPAPGEDMDVDGVGLAYQVGAGVKVDVADNVALDLGYRFKGFSGNLAGENTMASDGEVDWKADLGSHVLQVGVTFGF